MAGARCRAVRVEGGAPLTSAGIVRLGGRVSTLPPSHPHRVQPRARSHGFRGWAANALLTALLPRRKLRPPVTGRMVADVRASRAVGCDDVYLTVVTAIPI